MFENLKVAFLQKKKFVQKFQEFILKDNNDIIFMTSTNKELVSWFRNNYDVNDEFKVVVFVLEHDNIIN